VKPALAILALALAAPAAAQEAPAARPDVDVVFCIDCSGSMRQVIAGAKQKIWSIVNQVAKARPAPRLRIGLLGYGDKTREVHRFDLTEDLDQVYEQLMRVESQSIGEEWVGWAVGRAVADMSWSAQPTALRIVFVAGNETARQGPADQDPAAAARAALGRDIIVNAIYCGNGQEAELDSWREMARLAEGSFTSIDAGGGVVTVAAPQDARLAELNDKLNATYLAYGAKGKEARQNQLRQDANARKVGALADRAESKGGALYRTASWDLVEASKDPAFKLESVKDEELPEELRKLAPAERAGLVQKRAAEREALQKEIAAEAAARQKHVEAELKKSNLDASRAFDRVIQETIRAQAARKKLAFDE
jgi:hypothetical protein